MQVLVLGDPGEQPVADRVAAEPAGVAVADPGGQLLHGGVGDQAEHAVRPGEGTGGDLGRPGALQGHRVDGAGGVQIGADGGGVPVLLRRPLVQPGSPGAVAGGLRADGPVVAGEVVLGEQVDHQGGADRGGERGLLRPPGLAAERSVEVPAEAPRHVLVREPLARRIDMTVHQFGGDGLKFREPVDGPSRDDLHGCRSWRRRTGARKPGSPGRVSPPPQVHAGG